MPVVSFKSPRSIYQLKVTLQGSKPPIWRRLLVPGNFNLYQLHRVIQEGMGWYDSHLHQFSIYGEEYGTPDPDDWVEVKDERRHKLERVAPPGGKFKYVYDFGDNWDHVVAVEKILPPEPDESYPLCIKGKRACPPEDVGGLWGYAEFLEAINNPEHEQHDMFVEWIGEEFDPEAFDLAQVNQVLKSTFG